MGRVAPFMMAMILFPTTVGILDYHQAYGTNVIAYIPITLTNSQTSATPNTFQQMITLIPSSNSNYEASDLGNIRFCSDSSCSTQLDAWLETCTPSCSPSATSATAWVKLTSPIPANGGTFTIYEAFLSTSTDFDGNYWGESYQISNSFDNIANVMNQGLLTQIYYYSAGTCDSINNQNQLYGASVGNGVTFSGCANFISSVDPSTTAATGSTQTVGKTGTNPTESNVLINYRDNISGQYTAGGTIWPNPPIADQTKSWNLKSVGWVHVTSSTTMYAYTDDGVAIGTSTTQSGFTSGGADWLGGTSNPNNIISGAWHGNPGVQYSGTISSTGDNRFEVDYYEGGGGSILAMWSAPALNYYSFTYPPSGAMPILSLGSLVSVPQPTHSENIYYAPSIGNDYHNKFDGGITVNDKPFDINNYHTVIPQQVLRIGKPATFDFKIYDERGGDTIRHVGMYLHFKGEQSVINSDTWVSWDRITGIEMHDPNKIFSNANVTTKTDPNYLYANFTLTPQKTMPDSSLVMRMWDDKLVSGDVPIWGAIVIVDPNAPMPVKNIPTNQYGDYATLQKVLD